MNYLHVTSLSPGMSLVILKILNGSAIAVETAEESNPFASALIRLQEKPFCNVATHFIITEEMNVNPCMAYIPKSLQ